MFKFGAKWYNLETSINIEKNIKKIEIASTLLLIVLNDETIRLSRSSSFIIETKSKRKSRFNGNRLFRDIYHQSFGIPVWLSSQYQKLQN